jgi:Holliday junction resolvasome RuvABC endonuclease subunit
VIILGIDCSSTCLGWALLDGGACAGWGHYDLTGQIDERCEQAQLHAGALLDRLRPTLVVIEEPPVHLGGTVIVLAHALGAVLVALRQRRALWHKLQPSEGKKALTGSGAAKKPQMVEVAAAQLGLAGRVATKKSKVVLLDLHDGRVLLTEDEADAYALALAGQGVTVERVAA